MATQIQIRRDTAANWTAEDPILAEGEIGIEIDTTQFKIGDGTSTWSTLGDYFITGAAAGGISDGDKGDITVSGTGSVWSVNSPLELGDTLSPYYPANPISAHLIAAGHSSTQVLSASNGFTGTEFQYKLDLNGSTAKNYFGNLTQLDVVGDTASSSIFGQYIDISSNGITPTGVSEMVGIQTNVDVGGPVYNTYGARFSAYAGNASATSAGTMTGVLAQAGPVHFTNMGYSWAGDFELFTASGGAGTLDVGAAVRARLRLNSGATLTDFRGVSISDWTSPSGGSVTTMTGLYIDSSIDSFGTTKYAIRSLSTSDSVFSGAVRGPINPYDSTAWNGSDKFVTEDAIRDVLASGGAGITGAGTNTQAAFFSGVTTITNTPFEYASNTFTMFHTANTDVFKLVFTGAVAAGSGSFKVGNESTVENFLYVDGGAARIKVASRDVRLGDTEGFGNGTILRVDDTFSNSVIRFTASALDFTTAPTHSYYRTNTAAGTTGAQTINKTAGSVNFAAGATSLVVTNSLADTSSLIFITPQTNDATAKSFSVTRASGSFTITANAACTAETRVAFLVTN
jgi:hypothetical protein